VRRTRRKEEADDQPVIAKLANANQLMLMDVGVVFAKYFSTNDGK